jgi:glycosyltransferase involved in cell wall biosynthesis
MKVALLADPIDSQHAGIHVYTRELALSMQQYCKQIDLHVIRRGDNPSIVTQNNLFVKEWPLPGYRALRIFVLIPGAIWKLKPDVVIEPAHFGPFNLPRKIKRVVVIHDLTPILFPQWHNFHHGLLQKIFLPTILKRAALIIVNSENTLIDLQRVYPFTKGKSVKIYPGVDPFFITNKEAIVHQKAPFFLTTGTIEPRKNLTTLLDAYQQFREHSQLKYKLVICGGKGWKSDEFYKRLENHPFKNDIQLKGYVSKEELKHLYTTTTAFIYPSLYEGFGFPVAEAMSCGAPCIVSNRSSLPEVGGNAALYFDPENHHELTAKLTEIASSKEMVEMLSAKSVIQSARFSFKEFALDIEKFLLTVK